MPNPTPKPIHLVKGHRTKAEIKIREQGEKDLLTGFALAEDPKTKNNPVAHKEFLRQKKILKEIGHDDDIYNGTINAYCQLKAEIESMQEIDELKYDVNIMAKRKMMRDIEKENIMTMQSALRCVPKKPKEEPADTLQEYLAKYGNG